MNSDKNRSSFSFLQIFSSGKAGLATVSGATDQKPHGLDRIMVSSHVLGAEEGGCRAAASRIPAEFL